MTEDLREVLLEFLSFLNELSGNAPELGRPGQRHALPPFKELGIYEKDNVEGAIQRLKEAGARMPDFTDGAEGKIYDDRVRPNFDNAPEGPNGKQITVSELFSSPSRGTTSLPPH